MRSYSVLDVFTDVPLEGNPLAVFDDGSGLDGELMQRTACELNLSETVFVLSPDADTDAHARVRIFTPSTELPFAGHPVLGSAFVVGERDRLDIVRLQTGSGVVEVALRRSGDRITSGEMSQPLPTWEPLDCADAVLAALGVKRSALPVEVYDNGPRFAYVALESEDQVAALAPDIGALARLGPFGVSCFASSGGHARVRMFGPALGVAEDPATGSAAGPLAVHLARHGRASFGERIEIHQGIEIGRPSVLYAVAEGSSERLEAVRVAGSAVVVARGEYLLDPV
jgi:trans-2,3-dihydro-3-hydroxyanthranilate isomerase